MVDFLGTIVTAALMVAVVNALVVYLEIGRSAKLALAGTSGLWIGFAAAASASGWLTISDPLSNHGNFRCGPACRCGARDSLATCPRGAVAIGNTADDRS